MDALEQVIERQLEMERKAMAWDRLLQELEKNQLVSRGVLDWAKSLVHPAQTVGTSYTQVEQDAEAK